MNFLCEEMGMKQVKWLFFDVGGTLVDETDSFRRRVLQTIAIQKNLGNIYTPEYLEKAMRESALAGGSYFRGAMKNLGIFNFAPYDCIGERLYPDAKAVLETLCCRYSLGIIANQPAGTVKRLSEYGVGHLFALIFSSAEEGIEKPDPALFLRAIRGAGCEPSEICMIGDRPDNDIAPAKSLGMKTVRIAQGLGGLMPVRDASMQADRTAGSLRELLEIFDI